MQRKFHKGMMTCIAACVVMAAMSIGVSGVQAAQSQDAPPTMQGQPPVQGQPQAAQLSPQQLQELVAPIALYPDALVAQILAASAYPTQIVEAQRFLQDNSGLQGQALGAEVDKQDWDPSVKALTQFPSVLADLDKNLSWTSTLGDANMNQGAAVMDAVQFMRQKAQQAGNLKTTPQQTVSDQGSTVVIQPADPQIVYVPDYDPELIYGYPVGVWPGFYPWWGVGGPYLSFGVGFGVGPFFGFGWGWHGWGFDWGHRGLLFGGRPYGFHSHSFYDRNAYFHGNYRGFAGPNARGSRDARGFAAPGARGSVGTRGGARPGAFGGVTRGGDARGDSSRGRSSVGSGHSGGGGSRGSGGHAGGGGHGGGHGH